MGLRAKLGHTELRSSKDAPGHSTDVKRAGGVCPPVPSLWGRALTPRIPLLAAPPALDPTHLPGALLPEDTTSAPHLTAAGHEPSSPTWAGVSVPRRASVSPLDDGKSPAHSSPLALALPEHRWWLAHMGWGGQLEPPKGLSSPSPPRPTPGEQRGQWGASAVCPAAPQSQLHGSRAGTASLPAEQALGLHQRSGGLGAPRLRAAIKLRCLVGLPGGDVALCGRAGAGTGRGHGGKAAGTDGSSALLAPPGTERDQSCDPETRNLSSLCLEQSSPEGIHCPELATGEEGGRRAPWCLAGCERPGLCPASSLQEHLGARAPTAGCCL